jgi:hypothetical protein
MKGRLFADDGYINAKMRVLEISKDLKPHASGDQEIR